MKRVVCEWFASGLRTDLRFSLFFPEGRLTHAKTAKDLWLAGIEKEKENALARAASLKSSVSASSSKKRQQLENI